MKIAIVFSSGAAFLDSWFRKIRQVDTLPPADPIV